MGRFHSIPPSLALEDPEKDCVRQQDNMEQGYQKS
jgi:hypothetical protein